VNTSYLRKLGTLVFVGSVSVAPSANAAIGEHDMLEVGLAPPGDYLTDREDGFEVLGSDTWSYDDNIYRLSPGITDLAGLPGVAPGAVREDHIDTASARLDGQWSSGRQIVVGDFNIDDNRYNSNKNFYIVSGLDKLV